MLAAFTQALETEGLRMFLGPVITHRPKLTENMVYIRRVLHTMQVRAASLQKNLEVLADTEEREREGITTRRTREQPTIAVCSAPRLAPTLKARAKRARSLFES